MLPVTFPRALTRMMGVRLPKIFWKLRWKKQESLFAVMDDSLKDVAGELIHSSTVVALRHKLQFETNLIKIGAPLCDEESWKWWSEMTWKTTSRYRASKFTTTGWCIFRFSWFWHDYSSPDRARDSFFVLECSWWVPLRAVLRSLWLLLGKKFWTHIERRKKYFFPLCHRFW